MREVGGGGDTVGGEEPEEGIVTVTEMEGKPPSGSGMALATYGERSEA